MSGSASPRTKNTLLRASEFDGMPVVTIDGGEDIAEVRDVIYDADSHRLIGFTLNKRGFLRGKLRERLEAEEITAIGPDAVIVASEETMTEKKEAPEALAKPRSGRPVIGVEVITESGVRLGEVADVIVLTTGVPVAVGYQLTGEKLRSEHDVYIPIDEQMSISGEAVVLPESGERFIRDDLAGFGAAVAEFRGGQSPRVGVANAQEASS